MNRTLRSVLRTLAACFAGIAFLASTSSHAQAPAHILSLAVMDLEGRQIDAGSLDVLRDALIVELQNSGRLRVMERSQMSKILAEQGFQKSGACDGSECAVEVGKLLAVDRTLLGTVGKLGDSWSLTLRLVSVQTGEVLASVRDTKEGKIDALLKESIPLLAQQISNQFSYADGSISPKLPRAGMMASGFPEALLIIDSYRFRDDAGTKRLKELALSLQPSETFQLYQKGEISGGWAWANIYPFIPVGSMIKSDWAGVGFIYLFWTPLFISVANKATGAASATALLGYAFQIGRPIYFASSSNARLKESLRRGAIDIVPTPALQLDARGNVGTSLNWVF